MSLPIIKNATFTIKTKELKKPIKIRQMVFAEHKSIQQVTDIGNDSDTAITIGEIIEACTFGSIKADNVPQYLLDYIFIQLYMTSVEDVINTRYKCNAILKHEETGEPLFDEETGDTIICDTGFDVKLPLGQVAIHYPDDYEKYKTIKIDETTNLILRPLSLMNNIEMNQLKDSLIELLSEANDIIAKNKELPETELEALLTPVNDKINDVKDATNATYLYASVECIESEENKLYPETDFNKDEFIKWLNNAPSNVFSNIEQFNLNLPNIELKIHIECPKCGNNTDVHLKGLKDFFS